jgi:hypothetical protein
LAKANRVLKSWKLPIENCKNMRIRMHQVLWTPFRMWTNNTKTGKASREQPM